jgi:hypothetical protein
LVDHNRARVVIDDHQVVIRSGDIAPAVVPAITAFVTLIGNPGTVYFSPEPADQYLCGAARQ